MHNNDPVGTAFAPTCKAKNLVVTVAHNVVDKDGKVLSDNLHIVSKLEKPVIGPYVESPPEGFRSGNRVFIELVCCDVSEDWAVLKLKNSRSQFDETLDVLLNMSLLPRTKEEERFKIYHSPIEHFLKDKDEKVLDIIPTGDVKPYSATTLYRTINYPVGLSKGSCGGIALWKRRNLVVSFIYQALMLLIKAKVAVRWMIW